MKFEEIFLGKEIYSKQRGEGKIQKIEGNYMYADFFNKRSKFQFPEGFRYVHLKDEALQKKAEELIEFKEESMRTAEKKRKEENAMKANNRVLSADGSVQYMTIAKAMEDCGWGKHLRPQHSYFNIGFGYSAWFPNFDGTDSIWNNYFSDGDKVIIQERWDGADAAGEGDDDYTLAVVFAKIQKIYTFVGVYERRHNGEFKRKIRDKVADELNLNRWAQTEQK